MYIANVKINWTVQIKTLMFIYSIVSWLLCSFFCLLLYSIHYSNVTCLDLFVLKMYNGHANKILLDILIYKYTDRLSNYNHEFHVLCICSTFFVVFIVVEESRDSWQIISPVVTRIHCCISVLSRPWPL